VAAFALSFRSHLNNCVTNVALPDDFDKYLSTMRSRGVSVSIILQNLAQLKALFEKQHESIIGNCDEFLYLGGNELSTQKQISEMLGKETLDTNTFGKSTGRNGNYSTNFQITGRELMTPDEVRKLDNSYALLFIRGERPIMDEKYDIMRHHNLSHTADGNGKIYDHGESVHSVMTIEPISYDETPKKRKTPVVKPKEQPQDKNQSNQTEESEPDSILMFMSGEDLEEYLNKKTEDNQNEESNKQPPNKKETHKKPPVKRKA
jgi:type IV secretory pathway TraG/TraD family ATPase VirD4